MLLIMTASVLLFFLIGYHIYPKYLDLLAWADTVDPD